MTDMEIGLVNKTDDYMRHASLRRMLESISTEDSRVAGIGPGLFSIIVIAVFLLILLYLARYIRKAYLRRTIYGFAFIVVITVVIVFASASYVSDTTQLISNQSTDKTHIQRVQVTIVLCIWLFIALLSTFGGDSSPMLMYRQGLNIQARIDSKL